MDSSQYQGISLFQTDEFEMYAPYVSIFIIKHTPVMIESKSSQVTKKWKKESYKKNLSLMESEGILAIAKNYVDMGEEEFDYQ